MAERMATNAPNPRHSHRGHYPNCYGKYFNALKENNLDDKIFPILQIHDELVLKLKMNILTAFKQIIKYQMEREMPKDFKKI